MERHVYWTQREILYIDTVDRKTFCYTNGAVYESALRLYELEDRLSGWIFSGGEIQHC